MSEASIRVVAARFVAARFVAALGAAGLALTLAGAAGAQTPIRGGTLKYAAVGNPTTLDCAGMATPTNMAQAGPAYSTLVRYKPGDISTVVGDLAKSWDVSADGKDYTFHLESGVKFHDGSPFSSADIKATYDRMRNPPPGVISIRKSLFATIASIDTPDPQTVVFHLSKPTPGIIPITFASSYGCIYSAAALAKDPKYPVTQEMGTGPYKLLSFTPGSGMVYVRNPDYFVKGLPYLDRLEITFLVDPALQTAVASGQVDALFSNVQPTDVERIKASRGDKTVFPETGYNGYNLLEVNGAKKPLDDVRVRQALQYSIDRPSGGAMMMKLFASRGPGGIMPRGSKYDISAEELAKLPGFGPDLAANRATARKLLADAGQTDLHLTLNNRNTGGSYNPLGVFAIDQFKQIGVTLTQQMNESSVWAEDFIKGTYDVGVNTNVTNTNDPTEVLTKFLPSSNLNYSHINDPILQDIYDRQAVETDDAKRRALVTEFQQRVITQVYVIPFFHSLTIAAISANLKGWAIMPNGSLNTDLRAVWLDKQ